MHDAKVLKAAADYAEARRQWADAKALVADLSTRLNIATNESAAAGRMVELKSEALLELLAPAKG